MNFDDTPYTPAERAAAEKWMAKHTVKCPTATYEHLSVVSGYGYRLKVVCQVCRDREDVTDVGEHDPYPHR